MASADEIRAGMISRGMPPHVADAFILNFRDESGLNPGINEHNPAVPGSRGGYGLAQWTGPRRVALENYAASRGASVSDPNVQMDFLMSELQGPEAAAARSIFSAGDVGTAAAAILNKFLRPSESNRARREAAYTGGGSDDGYQPSGPFDTQIPQQQVASNQLPPEPVQNALRLPNTQLDPRAFMRQPNALAMTPLVYERRNTLGSIA